MFLIDNVNIFFLVNVWVSLVIWVNLLVCDILVVLVLVGNIWSNIFDVFVFLGLFMLVIRCMLVVSCFDWVK